MLRASLYAPLAGAILFVSPAFGQSDNRPGDYQRYAERQNADDEEQAQQGTAPQERDRYAYRRDDYRDAVRDDDEDSANYTVEPDRTERAVPRDSYQRESSRSDYDQAQPARDYYQRGPSRSDYDQAQPARDYYRQGPARSDYDQAQPARDSYQRGPSRSDNATEENAGDQPQPRADPAPTVRWDDRDQGQDPPTTYRGEPSRPDREEVLPGREMTPPAGTGGTAMTPFVSERAMGGADPAPRRDHSSAETIWHVRAALNVAALNCRDDEARTVAAYNGLLSTRQAALAAANAETKALYRIRFGERWQQMHDTEMTQLYNFFAQPAAHDDFCQVAGQVLDESRTVSDSAFADFADGALARLEAPFADSNRRADGSRATQGSWRRATS